MKRYPTLLSASWILSGTLQGQNVEYTVKDFTDRLSPMKLSISTAFFDVGLFQAGMLAQGVKGKFGYTAFYHQGLSSTMMLPKDNVMNADNAKTSRFFETGVDYFFADRLKENSAHVKTEVSSTMYSTKYFQAICNKRKLTGLHGGIIHYNQTVGVKKNTEDGLYLLETVNGMPPGNDQTFYFNTRSTYLFAGLVFKKVIKNTVNSNGWNYYKHYGRRIFMDVLFGGTSMEEITSGGNTYTLATKQTSPLGYRVGFEWDQMGVVTRFEIGQRPQRYELAIPGYNYIQLSFAFNVFQGDKTYAMSSKYTKKE